MEPLIYGNSSNLKSPVHRSLGGWCIALRKAVYVRGSIGLERKKQKKPFRDKMCRSLYLSRKYYNIAFMNYLELLHNATTVNGNCACVGLDVVPELLPSNVGTDEFLAQLLHAMKAKGLIPAAFKPNIAYFASLNNAFEENFDGYRSLARVMRLIRTEFPGVPIILDAKRGDIATTSLKYAVEVFKSWQADAMTVSPYMGHDSVLPFRKGFEQKGVYVLNRTSNAGAKDVQNLALASGECIYEKVAEQIIGYAREYPGTGAVVGATSLDELRKLAKIYAAAGCVPLLIPGVGSQGGSAGEVISALKDAGYDLTLVRINSSSGLTFPWKKEAVAPANWLDACLKAIEKFLHETKI